MDRLQILVSSELHEPFSWRERFVVFWLFWAAELILAIGIHSDREGHLDLMAWTCTPDQGWVAAVPTEGSMVVPIRWQVDLNRVSEAELETLPGIGPGLAKRIVEYRDSVDGFVDVAELLEVPGIGPKIYEEMVEHVTIDERVSDHRERFR